jgi:transposase
MLFLSLCSHVVLDGLSRSTHLGDLCFGHRPSVFQIKVTNLLAYIISDRDMITCCFDASLFVHLLPPNMPARKTSHTETNSATRNQLVGAILATENVAEAARLLDLPYSTACDIWTHFDMTGSVENEKRSGRPRILTERDVNHLELNAQKAQRKPFKVLRNEANPPLSESTVRRYLGEWGYKRRKARKVPYLAGDHKKARRKYVEKYGKWDKKKFATVTLSDECYIHLDDHFSDIYVTRRDNEVWEEDCLVPTFKQSSVHVMIWACIAKGQKGPLIVLDYPGGKGGGMTVDRYQEQVLESVLVEFLEAVKAKRGSVIFQQDNVPTHTAKKTLQWLEEHGIETMFHPPNSPDLGPIEHV